MRFWIAVLALAYWQLGTASVDWIGTRAGAAGLGVQCGLIGREKKVDRPVKYSRMAAKLLTDRSTIRGLLR